MAELLKTSYMPKTAARSHNIGSRGNKALYVLEISSSTVLALRILECRHFCFFWFRCARHLKLSPRSSWIRRPKHLKVAIPTVLGFGTWGIKTSHTEGVCHWRVLRKTLKCWIRRCEIIYCSYHPHRRQSLQGVFLRFSQWWRTQPQSKIFRELDKSLTHISINN